MKHIFMVNPEAGKGSASKVLLPKIIDIAKAKNLDYEAHRTLGPGEAEIYTRAKCREHLSQPVRIYACGGDGTLNEVVNGAIGYNDVEIGVIPAGTGDDFVRNFDKPAAFRDVVAQIEGTSRPIDVIEYRLPRDEESNWRCAINMCNIGFDAQVVAKTAEMKKKPMLSGSAAYIASLGIVFAKKKTVGLVFEFEGGDRIESEFLLAAIANGCYCGGGFKGVPNAIVDDSLIDVSIVNSVTRRFFLTFIKSYHEGTHLDNPETEGVFIYEKTKSVRVTSKEEFTMAVDGEIVETDCVEFKVKPDAINFIIPRGINNEKN